MLKRGLALIVWSILVCAACIAQNAREAQLADLEFIRINYVERSRASYLASIPTRTHPFG